MRVIDAAGLKNPVVVGHSWAGEEMHVLGDRHSTRITGLVYVDAAFDRGDKFEEYEAAARAMPRAPQPKPADLASFTTLRAYLTRTYGPLAGKWPEARVARHAKWFAAFADRRRVAELSGGHDLFVSNPREVVEQIDAFVSRLAHRR